MRVTEIWRLKSERYSLQGSQDPSTEEVSFPPRPVPPRKVELYDFHNEESAFTDTNAVTLSIIEELAAD